MSNTATRYFENNKHANMQPTRPTDGRPVRILGGTNHFEFSTSDELKASILTSTKGREECTVKLKFAFSSHNYFSLHMELFLFFCLLSFTAVVADGFTYSQRATAGKHVSRSVLHSAFLDSEM